MISVVEILTRTEAWLQQRGIPQPRYEAELLLGHVLHLERLQLYLAHDRPVTDVELAALRPLVARRGQREPLHWILGERGFHAIDLKLRPGVLVPRPDTETLVDAALQWIPQSEEPTYVADVGCGSGAVGLAIAHARPEVRLYATDLSPDALETTRENVEALRLTNRVAVLEGDLLSPIPPHRPIDWIVSNPPYIPTEVLDGLQPEVSRWEPRLALDGGPDGLDVYRRLIPEMARRARRGALVEVGRGQADTVATLFERAEFSDVTTWEDLGGVTRVVGGRCPSP